MTALIRTLLAWAYAIAFWIAFLLVYKALSPERMTRLIRFWGRSTLVIVGIRLRLLSPSTLEGRESRVMLVNHQSALDLVWGAAICPEAPLAIGKKEVAFVPVINLIWWALDFIRIDRQDSLRARAKLDGVADVVVRGKRTLAIAPEGTRTPTGELLPFKKGAFHIAIQAQVPICPIVVSGAYGLMPRTSFVAKSGELRVKFLPPVETRGLTAMDVDALRDRVREQMAIALHSMP